MWNRPLTAPGYDRNKTWLYSTHHVWDFTPSEINNPDTPQNTGKPKVILSTKQMNLPNSEMSDRSAVSQLLENLFLKCLRLFGGQ